MKQSNILITIGEDEEIQSPSLKAWNLDKIDKNENPLCIRTLKLFPGKKVFSVTTKKIFENDVQSHREKNKKYLR